MVLHRDQPQVPVARDGRPSRRATGSTRSRRFTDPRVAPSRSCSCGAASRRRARPARAGRRERSLEAARSRTLELVAPLSDAQLTHQHSPLMSPIVWDLGHIANFEEQWIRRAHDPRGRRDDDGARPRPALRRRRAPARHARPPAAARARGVPALPRATSGGRRSTSSRGGIVPRRRAAPRRRLHPRHARAARGAAQRDHPADDPADRRPRLRAAAPARAAAAPLVPVDEAAEAVVPAGPFLMGTDDRRFAYDNERPAHEVGAAALPHRRPSRHQRRSSSASSTTAATAAASCGPTTGWRWLHESGVAHPAQWRRGERRRLAASAPSAAWSRSRSTSR